MSLFVPRKITNFRGGKDLFPTVELTWCHFFLLQSIRISIFFYGLELVLKVSFRVRNRFRIRINNVMSVWQLATTVSAILDLVLPIRHSSGFTFVAIWLQKILLSSYRWSIQLYKLYIIDHWFSQEKFACTSERTWLARRSLKGTAVFSITMPRHNHRQTWSTYQRYLSIELAVFDKMTPFSGLRTGHISF